jgi:hypothetical protein
MAKVATRVVMAEGESILHGMFNLICTDGHKAFSPQPMSLVGAQCPNSRENGQKCNKKLVFLADSRAVPQPKVKSKLRKMKRY